MWWDGDMGEERNRTLLSWGLAGGQWRRKPYRKNHKDSGPRPERQSPKVRAWKDRRLAEMVEGIPGHHDQQDLSSGPFGRSLLWRWNDHWKRAGRHQQQWRRG